MNPTAARNSGWAATNACILAGSGALAPGAGVEAIIWS